jgi:hypothetical protein
MQLLREGDTLTVTRLDRLSRSVLHLVTLGAELRERGIGLHVIEQGIDTATMEGRAMFGMLSVLAELQRELIVDGARPVQTSARILRCRTDSCALSELRSVSQAGQKSRSKSTVWAYSMTRRRSLDRPRSSPTCSHPGCAWMKCD